VSNPTGSADRTADVIVVGAGLVGLFTAFHLARLGAGRVLVVEAGRPAAQASARSGALVRCHYTSLHEARMAWAALPWWREWADRVGGACGFTATGFLQLVDASDNDTLRANTAALAADGIRTEILDAAAVRAAYPYVRMADDEIAAYEPGSGYAVPADALGSLAAACRRDGVEIRPEEPVREVLTGAGGAASGVRTARGTYAAPVVVLANGAWSVPLLAPLGVTAPISPHRVQVAFLARPPSLGRGPGGHVTIIDRRYGCYLRPAGDGETLVGLSVQSRTVGELTDPADPDALGPGDGAAFAGPARRAAAGRIPAFAEAPRTRGHTGPLDVTPDHRMILGGTPGVPGLYLAVGMSGGGFKKAPAIGAAMAELIVEGAARTAPVEPFRLSRFAERKPITAREYSVPADGDPDRRQARDLTPLIH